MKKFIMVAFFAISAVLSGASLDRMIGDKSKIKPTDCFLSQNPNLAQNIKTILGLYPRSLRFETTFSLNDNNGCSYCIVDPETGLTVNGFVGRFQPLFLIFGERVKEMVDKIREKDIL